MNLDTVTLIATVPAILALVNLAKRFGVRDTLSLALAVVLGVALNLGDYFWSGAGWYSAATQGLILGLGAAGLYDVTDRDAPTVAVLSSAPVDEVNVVTDTAVQGAPWPDNWPPEAPD